MSLKTLGINRVVSYKARYTKDFLALQISSNDLYINLLKYSTILASHDSYRLRYYRSIEFMNFFPYFGPIHKNLGIPQKV
jgi:hypothetical protein